jgi:hypothetical protein
MMSLALMARKSQVTRAILRDLSPAGHARAVEFLDRQSGEVGMLCGNATEPCRASGGFLPGASDRGADGITKA